MSNKAKLLKSYNTFKGGLEETCLSAYAIDNAVQLLIQMDVCRIDNAKRVVSLKTTEGVLNHRFESMDRTTGIVKLIEDFYDVAFNSTNLEIHPMNLQTELKMLDKHFGDYSDAFGDTLTRACYRRIRSQLSRIARLGRPRPSKDVDLVKLTKKANGRKEVQTKVTVELEKPVYKKLSYLRSCFGFQETKDVLEYLILCKPLAKRLNETSIYEKNVADVLTYMDNVSDRVIAEDFAELLKKERQDLLFGPGRAFVRLPICLGSEVNIDSYEGKGVTACLHECFKKLEKETPIGNLPWTPQPIDRTKLRKDLKRLLISLQRINSNNISVKSHIVRDYLRILRGAIKTHYGITSKRSSDVQVSCFINVRNDLYLRLINLTSVYGFKSIRETAAYCVDPL